MLKKFTFLNLLTVCSTVIYAQSISKIETKADVNKIVISYFLECRGTAQISLFCSIDNGTTWEGPLKSVSGDVGKNITPGQKQMIWDVLKDRDILASEKVIFKIMGSSIFGSVKDSRDNKTYLTVIINNQEWFIENLNHYTASGSWYYNNDSAAFSRFGRLYDWKTAIQICPDGWHLPADLEWETLFKSLGGKRLAGGKLKSVSGWSAPDTGTTDESNFTVLPGGLRKSNGKFIDQGISGNFWSSSSVDATYAYSVLLKNSVQEADLYQNFKDMGMSVRCVRHMNTSSQNSNIR